MIPNFIAAFKFCSRIASAYAALVGVLVLVGWLFDIAILKSVLPDMAMMKANTALCFLLAGISLWLAEEERRMPAVWQSRVSLACAAAVFIIGLLTLTEFVLGVNVGIDELLFRDARSAIETSWPGRMSFAGALNFVFIGMALILLERRRGDHAVQFLAAAAGAFSLVALTGYSYGAQSFYTIADYTAMAVHTAATFGILSLGILFARPHHGYMVVLTQETMGGVMARRLLPSALGILLLLRWLRMHSEKTGLYYTEIGMALFAVADVILFTALIWWNVESLNRIDEERRWAVEAVRASEERLRRFFEMPLVGMAMLSRKRIWLDANEKMCEILGYSHVELAQMTWTEVTHSGDLARERGEFEKMATGETAGCSLEKRCIRGDKRIVRVKSMVRCVRRADGAIDYFVALLQEVAPAGEEKGSGSPPAKETA